MISPQTIFQRANCVRARIVYFAEEGETRQLFDMCAERHIAFKKLLLVVNPYKHANEFPRYLTMVFI